MKVLKNILFSASILILPSLLSPMLSPIISPILTLPAFLNFSSSSAFALSLDEQTDVYTSYALEAKADYAGATQKIVKLQSANPENYFLNYRLGYLFGMSKKYSNAILHYEKAAKIAPDSVEPWLALSLLSYYSGDDTTVISASKEILKRDPHQYFGYLRLAGALLRAKDYAAALNIAKEGNQLYPTDVGFLEQKGVALKMLGKKNEAMAVAQQIILISPTNLFAKSVLAPSK